MKKIDVNDSVFQKMVTGNDDIVFNLFYLIRNSENAMIYTDDKHYIVAQSNYETPVWVYINGELKDNTVITELKELMKASIAQNANVHINAQKEYFQPIMDELKKEEGIILTEFMPMNVYACSKVIEVESSGECITPNAEYKQAMAELIKQMAKDGENHELSDAAAHGFANAMEASKDLFLWKDEEIVSMAMIAHRTEKYARINTVVTDRKYRGKGYAKMLVGEISRKLIENKIIPMLYADARNPSSNTTYQKIGYVKVGEITEFAVNFIKS